MGTHELAVIIPTFNEAGTIQTLLEGLDRQQQIHLQIIIVDGGSTDNTLVQVKNFFTKSSLSHQILNGDRGRAKQLNQGARIANAEMLVFLHADSELNDPHLLIKAIDLLKSEFQFSEYVAGHFGLHFRRQQNTASLAYNFYESKTRLNRLDTINGDQGFMLTKGFFQVLDGFDESLDYMEDFRLARKIFAMGQWITLPGVITTSARRFESEGLKQRQILNALLCNFDHIGLTEFYREAADAYQAQDHTERLQLQPFFLLIHRIAKRIGMGRTIWLWYKTGAYVAGNVWQLAFALDCRRNFKNHTSAGEGPTPTLSFYDKWLKSIIDSPPGHLLAAGLTFIWFYLTLLLLTLRK